MSEWQPNKPTVGQIQTHRHWQRRMSGDESGIIIDFEVSIEGDSVRYTDRNNEWLHSVEFWADDKSSYWDRDVYRPKPDAPSEPIRDRLPKLRNDIQLLATAIWPEEHGIFDVNVVDSVLDATRKYAQFRFGPYEISVMGDSGEPIDKVVERIWDLLKERATRRINELRHAVFLR